MCPNLLRMLTWEGGHFCRASLHFGEVTCTYLSAINSLGNLSCVSGSLEVTVINWGDRSAGSIYSVWGWLSYPKTLILHIFLRREIVAKKGLWSRSSLAEYSGD